MDPETDPNTLRYATETDFRAEMNLVHAELGPHHQGVLSLVDNLERDGGTVVVPRFHSCFDAWRQELGRWEESRTGQRRRGCSYNFVDPLDPIHALAR